MNQEKRTKIVIIGGVAGGASAAARARRLSETAEIVIIERGAHVSFANCGLPYHIGGEITDKEALLLQTPESLKARFNIDVFISHEVMAVDAKKKNVTVKNLQDQSEFELSYDKLILSPGAHPIIPPIEGVRNPATFSLRNISDMESILHFMEENKPKKATVCGGGFIGIEMVEALRHKGIEVTLVELAPQIMTTSDPEMAFLIEQELTRHHVSVCKHRALEKVNYDSKTGLSLTLSDGKVLHSDLLIMAIGVRPETALAVSAGVKLGETGGIEVNQQMQTSDPDIYAVGDAAQVIELTSGRPSLIPLAGPANRQGRLVANHIFGMAADYKKSQGSAICKVFDMVIASTGLNERLLKKYEIAYEKIYTHTANHASYYPNAQAISLKLLFSPTTGKILGAQAVGREGVDKRIDLIAMAQRAEMTVFDLQDLELCYAPPFNSAKDVLNQAGFVAGHLLDGSDAIIHADALEKAQGSSDLVVIDLRNPDELKEWGTVAGAINIPLNNLREALSTIPQTKEIVVFCQVGLRGHVGARLLKNKGYQVRNLSGGYLTWLAYQGAALG